MPPERWPPMPEGGPNNHCGVGTDLEGFYIQEQNSPAPVVHVLYKTYVRPHLEYAVTAWSPWQIGDIDKLERVQKRMVAAVSGLKGNTYEEKLEEIGMETLTSIRNRLECGSTL